MRDSQCRDHSSLTGSHAGLGRVLDIHGDGRLRGEIHGESLREIIASTLERWRSGIAARHKVSPDVFVERFLNSTRFVETVTRETPDLRDEVEAIAAASNQPAAEIWVLNLMDEEWRFGHSKGIGCSVLAGRLADPLGVVAIGQNMDLPSYMGGSQAVLRIAARDGEPAQIVMTAAGMVGLLGLNQLGLACCVNTLKDLPSSTDGLPVAFVLREILRRRNAKSALALLNTVDHASGQHYAIADQDFILGAECSASGCSAVEFSEQFAHTNHPLWTAPEVVASVTEPTRTDTFTRLSALEAALPYIRTQGDIERTLSDGESGLCVRPTETAPTTTFCSVEFVLETPPAVRVALGTPDKTEWESIGWAGDVVTQYDPC